MSLPIAIVVAVIGFIGSVCLSCITYYFTRKREFENSIRNERIAYYKSFMDAFNTLLVKIETTPKNDVEKCYKAMNDLNLMAPQQVINLSHSFFKFLEEAIEKAKQGKNDESQHMLRQAHETLSGLFLEIRKDIGLPNVYCQESFEAGMQILKIKR